MTTAPVAMATWFHADRADSAGSYAQMRGDPTASAHFEVYLNCVDICVATFRRWNDGPCFVVLNPLADSAVSHVRREFWRRMRVQVCVVENSYQDRPLASKWRNQTYLFDVIAAAAERLDDAQQPLIVIDSDCVILDDLDALGAEIRQNNKIAMTVGEPAETTINGLSQLDLRELHNRRTDQRRAAEVVYRAGEFVAGTREYLLGLVYACREVMEWALVERDAGRRAPTEEAHVISLADPMTRDEARANRLVERVWTQPWRFRNVSAISDELVIWHLPSEKRTGFRVLTGAVRSSNSWFWRAPHPEWKSRLGQRFGVPKYGVRKYATDGLLLLLDRLFN